MPRGFDNRVISVVCTRLCAVLIRQFKVTFSSREIGRLRRRRRLLFENLTFPENMIIIPT